MTEPLTRPPAVRSDARANRERLIAAAHAVVAERGPDAEMKEIAERAGVGIGTIYRNFATKAELLTALVDDIHLRIESGLGQVVDVEHPRASLEALLEMIWDVVDNHGGLWQAFQDGTLPEECVDLDRKERVHARAVRLFEAGVAKGVFTSEIPPADMAVLTEGVAKCYLDLKGQTSAKAARASCRAFLLRGLLADAGNANAERGA